jgi:hypothetical protein
MAKKSSIDVLTDAGASSSSPSSSSFLYPLSRGDKASVGEQTVKLREDCYITKSSNSVICHNKSTVNNSKFSKFQIKNIPNIPGGVEQLNELALDPMVDVNTPAVRDSIVCRAIEDIPVLYNCASRYLTHPAGVLLMTSILSVLPEAHTVYFERTFLQSTAIPENLAKMESLFTLYFRDHRYEKNTIKAVKHLVNSPTLRALDFSFNNLAEDAIEVAKLFATSTTLRVLNLNACNIGRHAVKVAPSS